MRWSYSIVENAVGVKWSFFLHCCNLRLLSDSRNQIHLNITDIFVLLVQIELKFLWNETNDDEYVDCHHQRVVENEHDAEFLFCIEIQIGSIFVLKDVLDDLNKEEEKIATIVDDCKFQWWWETFLLEKIFKIFYASFFESISLQTHVVSRLRAYNSMANFDRHKEGKQWKYFEKHTNLMIYLQVGVRQ